MNLEDQQDHRQWTQQHLDAADLRIPSIAPTPPQGENENDCMDVNVRGPGKVTVLEYNILIKKQILVEFNLHRLSDGLLNEW